MGIVFFGTAVDQLFMMPHTWDTPGIYKNINQPQNYIFLIFIHLHIFFFFMSFRSYISFDILRRVLSDYFNYDVLYVMNITDIDDKIIKRARQNYLYEKYIEENHELDKILKDIKNVISSLDENIKTTIDNDKKTMMVKMMGNIKLSLEEIEACISAKNNLKTEEAKEKLLIVARDSLSDWLDKKYGATVNENAIFNKLSQHWEDEFHKDMDSLNVQRPNVLTRVSEYVPEIIDYIQKIIDNGLAYESNGSVYFDVASFDKKEHHHYAKLVPEAYGDAASLQEGEGEEINIILFNNFNIKIKFIIECLDN